MAFVKKTWKDRISQFPNRRTINDGNITKTVTVGRDEGVVTEEGDAFSADNMNDLENRILAAYNGGGGGGGFSGDYDDLYNKPKINNVALSGNKTLNDLSVYGKTIEMSDTDSDKVADRIMAVESVASDLKDEFSDWTTSNTSFVDACDSLGIYSGIGNVLDNLKTNIGSYGDQTMSNRVDNTQGPIYFMIFGKANDNYFTGILLSYFPSQSERQPLIFAYTNGVYSVKRI